MADEGMVWKYELGQEPGCAGLQPPGMEVGTGVETEAAEYCLRYVSYGLFDITSAE